MEMTLSRALRYKKRIIEKIRKLETDIQSNNSKAEGEERDADVKMCMKQRSAWTNHLIDFKLALQEATKPIQRLVFELAETKAELSFLQRISTTKGQVKARYREEPTMTYTAEITKKDVDTRTEELQKRIDELQTRIDAHNATTNVAVRDPELS